jgi:hypothetical protein
VEIPKANEPDSTAAEALYNCVNILLGCGVLTIPYALNEGGWAALGVLALMGLSTNYTGPGLFLCSSFLVHARAKWVDILQMSLIHSCLFASLHRASVCCRQGTDQVSGLLFNTSRCTARPRAHIRGHEWHACYVRRHCRACIRAPGSETHLFNPVHRASWHVRLILDLTEGYAIFLSARSWQDDAMPYVTWKCVQRPTSG